jgi:pyridinium-3,5-bisthiocarboxylic acid mononucleotide nickel chelatase
VKVAYFDCFSGISGDMVLGALVDAGGSRDVLDATVSGLQLDGEVTIDVHREQRGHLGGTRVIVHAEPRSDRQVAGLRHAVERAGLPDAVRSSALAAIERIAEVESAIHGEDIASLHLHELSGADTLVDLVGAFWLMHDMGVSAVFSSPLPAPRGVRGALPLPAPASVRVLAGTGAVFEETDAREELVTPTGAAILSVSAEFRRPALELHSIGYGIGARPAPGNALAVWIGTEVASETGVTVIETNIDDMAPNILAALVEDLMAAGALDVTVTPALMKKGRLGHLVAVMAQPDHVAALTEQLLRQSTTLGVRLTPVRRVLAGRRSTEVRTPLGMVRVKVKELGGKAIDVAPEYEDCRRLARERGQDLRDVMRIVTDAARRELGLG